MKTIKGVRLIHVTTIFFIACLGVFESTAQKPTPFKGANVLIIKTSLSGDDTYKALGRQLVSEGYSIDVNNKDFLQMKTAFRGIGSYINLKYEMTLSVKDSTIIIRPQVDMGPPIGVNEWRYEKARITKNAVVEKDIISKLGTLGTIYYDKL